jgi:hypothetical protein
MTVDGAPAVWVTEDADETKAHRVTAEDTRGLRADLIHTDVCVDFDTWQPT